MYAVCGGILARSCPGPSLCSSTGLVIVTVSVVNTIECTNTAVMDVCKYSLLRSTITCMLPVLPFRCRVIYLSIVVSHTDARLFLSIAAHHPTRRYRTMLSNGATLRHGMVELFELRISGCKG